MNLLALQRFMNTRQNIYLSNLVVSSKLFNVEWPLITKKGC